MCKRDVVSDPLSILTPLTTERVLNKTYTNVQHETSVELNLISVIAVYTQISVFLS
jgi:transcriptional regulator of met regulon